MIYGLTLTQPWAFGFALGKRIENRDWIPPSWNCRQDRQKTIELALHGGKFPVGKERLEQALYDLDFLLTRITPSSKEQEQLLEKARGLNKKLSPVEMLRRVSREGIFAYTETSSFISNLLGLDYGSDQKQWFFGDYGWEFENYRRLNAVIPCRGALKLWQLPSDVLEQLKLGLPEVFEGRR
jgi:hypothetical protein